MSLGHGEPHGPCASDRQPAASDRLVTYSSALL